MLFTAAPNKRVPREIAGVPITRIGYIHEDSEILIEHENGYQTELEAGGWEHFSEASVGKTVRQVAKSSSQRTRKRATASRGRR